MKRAEMINLANSQHIVSPQNLENSILSNPILNAFMDILEQGRGREEEGEREGEGDKSFVSSKF